MSDNDMIIKTEEQRHGAFHGFWIRFRRNKGAVVGLIVFVILLLLIAFADFIADYQNDAIKQNASIRLQGPSREHLFGTDQLGRDIFARVLFGARTSYKMSFSIVGITLVIGSSIGAVSGFYGGLIDSIIMRTMDMLLAIPSVLLAIAVVAALGASQLNLVVALTIAGIPGNCRFFRSMVLTLRGQEYIESARAVGTGDLRVLSKHIVPNAIGPVIVSSTLGVGSMILSTAGLSFIGLGIQPPTPEWGTMLLGGRDYIMTHPHMIIFPGLAIVVTVLSLNLLSDGLRDTLDPRMR